METNHLTREKRPSCYHGEAHGCPGQCPGTVRIPRQALRLLQLLPSGRVCRPGRGVACQQFRRMGSCGGRTPVISKSSSNVPAMPTTVLRIHRRNAGNLKLPATSAVARRSDGNARGAAWPLSGNYKKRYSDIIAANSRCFSAMIVARPASTTGNANRRTMPTARPLRTSWQWRERALESIAKAIEAAKPEEQRQEEAWQELKKDLDRTITSIHALDTGKERGYNRGFS